MSGIGTLPMQATTASAGLPAPVAGAAAGTQAVAGAQPAVADVAATGAATTAAPTSTAATVPVQPSASNTPAKPADAIAAPTAATTPSTVSASNSQPAAPATGVTFPVRPAAIASTQAPANAVGHAAAADAGSIGGALFSLALVVGLILALGWLAKRMPGLQRGAGNTGLRVVASVALGPRDRAVVVDVGGTQLLLGVGPGGVRALHTLDAPLPAPEIPGGPSPFAQILAQHFGRKP